jgi:hypothetical protein
MPTSQNWINQLQGLTAAYFKAFGNLTPDQLNWKPNPGIWSIGQVIDHVITVNETYYSVVEQLKSGTYRTPWTAKLPFLVNWFGGFILGGVEPDRKRKIKTFPIWEPAQSDVLADIIQRFADHHEKLGAVIASCESFLQTGTVISSPANRNIVYKLDTAFDIIVAHERRHLNQALEVLEWMKKARV